MPWKQTYVYVVATIVLTLSAVDWVSHSGQEVEPLYFDNVQQYNVYALRAQQEDFGGMFTAFALLTFAAVVINAHVLYMFVLLWLYMLLIMHKCTDDCPNTMDSFPDVCRSQQRVYWASDKAYNVRPNWWDPQLCGNLNSLTPISKCYAWGCSYNATPYRWALRILLAHDMVMYIIINTCI